MRTLIARRPLVWALGLAAAVIMVGCPSGTSTGDAFTRRGVEREYLSSPEFGGPRGQKFEDLIPVGARITEVHVAAGEQVNGIWLSYERNGTVRETPQRGSADGKVHHFKLKADEKIIGIHGFGKSSVEGLVIATNKRTQAFGAVTTSRETPWYDELSEDNRRRYVAVGIVGRADTQLRQISVRLQVRGEG